VGARGLQADLGLLEDEAELVNVIAAVEALAARASRWNDLVVAILPGTQGLHRDIQHLGHRSDAVDAHRVLGRHPHLNKYVAALARKI
jgi:hypothetical protein